MKILLTGGKSAVALKLLKAFSKDKVVLADYGDVPVFASDAYQYISLGIKNEDVLAHTLLNNCLNEGVDAILPLHSFEIEALAKAKVLFEEFNISLLLPSVSEMRTYLKPENNNKKDHWAVFMDGSMLFATMDSDILPNEARNSKLNGAFYVHDTNQFTLITI